jgi:type IV pilus assembly protein PilE
MNLQNRMRGFTLIELLVTITIIGILAAIAIPSYTAYINRANRSDARGQLLEAAAFMQRAYSQNNAYPNALPSAYQQSPASGAAKYTLSVTNPSGTATSYVLRATRAGTMAGDECGDFTLDQAGVRGIVSAASGRTPTDCWNR